MTRLLDIGVSGLAAHQSALATTGNNIANAGVEGYSRQQAVFVTRESQFTGSGFQGSGVSIETIRRITDQFAVQQVITDTARASELSVFSEGLGQLDQLLTSENTGLASVLDSLFASLQSASESPTSIPLRQQVLSNLQRLSDRYGQVQGQLQNLASASNEIIGGITGEINAIAKGIADINRRLARIVTGSQQDSANDLLDKRENLLRQLAEKVSFTSIKQDGESINVFIAGGQPLVLGFDTNELKLLESESGGFEVNLAIDVNGDQRRISGQLNGGELGGNLKFREQGLADIADQIGLVQTLVVHNLNTLHNQGVDLAGAVGGDLFTALDDRKSELSRVVYDPANSSSDTVVSIAIDDPSSLVASSYELQFNSSVGPFGYTITRKSDGVVVNQGILPTAPPQSISVRDGFTVNLEAGTFTAGDRFTLTPARLDSGAAQLLVSDPAALAFALPVAAEPFAGNTGNGLISQVSASGAGSLTAFELAAISNARASTPPLLLRFTSSTSFDVLDNSDPLAPTVLSPELKNITFVPGQSNPVLAQAIGSQVVSSAAAFSQLPNVGAIGTTGNGNAGEVATFSLTDPVTSAVNTQNVTVLAGESAATAALRFREVQGVTAFANNELRVAIGDDGVGAPLQLSLNGVDLTSTAMGAVPQPLTSNFLAGRINSLLGSAGITASDQNGSLFIRSLRGDDLVLQNTGTGADTLDIVEANGATVATTINSGQEATLGGTLALLLDPGISASSSSGFLGGASVEAFPAFTGYDFSISGAPRAGDRFSITLGASGSGDNRNALAMAQLQTAPVLGRGNASISDVYSSAVGIVGSRASAARIDSEAANSLLAQSEARQASISGVNLDEEAAKLLEYEQAYNAAARIISIARSTFDTLISAFS